MATTSMMTAPPNTIPFPLAQAELQLTQLDAKNREQTRTISYLRQSSPNSAPARFAAGATIAELTTVVDAYLGDGDGVLAEGIATGLCTGLAVASHTMQWHGIAHFFTDAAMITGIAAATQLTRTKIKQHRAAKMKNAPAPANA